MKSRVNQLLSIDTMLSFRRLLRLKSCLLRSSRNASNAQPSVLVERQKNILFIALNRPDKRNCVNIETGERLLEAFAQLEEDATLDVGILHGIGGNFCAGFDLEELASMKGTDRAALIKRGPMGPSQMFTSKPLVAAIDGYAVAGGLELALLCDIRVVDESAVLGVFCRRFGVPLIDGGTVRLPALIGLSRALDLILTGRAVKAKEAVAIGLASECVKVGTALGNATTVAQSIAKFPQECMRADRRSAYFSTFEAKSLEEALLYEFENGKGIVEKEAIHGAEQFVKEGIGRHGKFNLQKFKVMMQDVEPKVP